MPIPLKDEHFSRTWASDPSARTGPPPQCVPERRRTPVDVFKPLPSPPTPTGQLPTYNERMARRQDSQQSLRSAPSTVAPRAQSTARIARPVSHAPRDARVVRMYKPEDFVGEIPVMLDQEPKEWDRTARARREPPARQGRS